jgi:predicted regulator of Ras-like GTPase activity (Roadblock/LC7/MglB family)
MPSTLPDAPLEQLAAIPGVVGGLLFGPDGEVFASRFPAVFDPAGLAELASRLAADAWLRASAAGEGRALELRYGDGTVMIRSVADAWLLVLCTTQANAQLVSMALTQAVRRLRASVGPTPSARDRLRAVVQSELGAQAPRALEALAAVTDDPQDLRRAADEIEKVTKLFISVKKAGEIARRMKDVLGV